MASDFDSTNFAKLHVFVIGLGEIRRVGGDQCGSIVETSGTMFVVRVKHVPSLSS